MQAIFKKIIKCVLKILAEICKRESEREREIAESKNKVHNLVIIESTAGKNNFGK